MTTKTSEREEFESWYEAHLMPLESNWFRRELDGDYAYADTQTAFDAWQARAQLSTKQEWQPIETAPKDGTKILVGRFVEHCGEGKNGHIKVDWWRRTFDKTGYVGWGEFNNSYWPATHWMPLPESPIP